MWTAARHVGSVKKPMRRGMKAKIDGQDQVLTRILVVDDEEDLRLTMADILQLNQLEVVTVASATGALEMLEKSAFDLVLTDLVMPRMDGIALTKAIKEMGLDIPVIVMTGFGSIEHAVESMKAGASDFVTKPFTPDYVIHIIKRVLETRHLREIAQERDYYKELSDIDGLTGIGNYRYFNQMLQIEVERQKRHNRPLALMVIDIDDFKRFNDSYGHLVGDQVLVQIAFLLRRSIRGTDFVARYGGEEFMVILPEISEKEAIRVGERILSSIKDFKFRTPDERTVGGVTVTIGLSSFPEDTMDRLELITKADQALYQGKRAGKGCLCVYNQPNNIIRI